MGLVLHMYHWRSYDKLIRGLSAWIYPELLSDAQLITVCFYGL